MTTKPIIVSAKSNFSIWLKRYGPTASEDGDAIDIQDIDYIIFSYLTGELMTLETKERNSEPSGAQNDTQGIIKQLLTLSSGKSISTLRGKRPIKYLGHHLIQFQNTHPGDGLVKLDGKVIDKRDLLLFLNFSRPLQTKNGV